MTHAHAHNCKCSSCTAIRINRERARRERDFRAKAGKNYQPKTCDEALIVYGHDYDFVPVVGQPTQELPGTAAKVEVMRQRVLAGEELFHPEDKHGFDGCKPGEFRTRDKGLGDPVYERPSYRVLVTANYRKED